MKFHVEHDGADRDAVLAEITTTIEELCRLAEQAARVGKQMADRNDTLARLYRKLWKQV